MDLFWVSNRVPKARPHSTYPAHVEEASVKEEWETSFFSSLIPVCPMDPVLVTHPRACPMAPVHVTRAHTNMLHRLHFACVAARKTVHPSQHDHAISLPQQILMARDARSVECVTVPSTKGFFAEPPSIYKKLSNRTACLPSLSRSTLEETSCANAETKYASLWNGASLSRCPIVESFHGELCPQPSRSALVYFSRLQTDSRSI